MHPLLENCCCAYTHKVTWREMDALQHVNNAEYFHYFEHARIVHLEQLKLMGAEHHETVGPILGETGCRFILPLTYPDTIHIGVSVEDLREFRFLQRYTVVSEKLNKVVATGFGKVFSFDYQKQQKAPIPEQAYKLLQSQTRNA